MGLLTSLGSFGEGAGSLISGIGNLFGIGRPSLKDQTEASKELAKYEHDLSMDAWREQTAYNDPSRQMERLKAAGINPNSIAGNASMAGNATAAPTASVGDVDVSKFQKGPNLDGLSSIFSSVLSFENAKTELENKKLVNDQVREQTKLTEQDKLYRQLEQDNMRLNMAWNKAKMYQEGELFKRNTAMQDALLDKTYAEINEISARIDETNARISNIGEDTLNKKDLRNQIKALAEKYGWDAKTQKSLYNHFYSKGLPVPVDHGPSKDWSGFVQETFGPFISHVKGSFNENMIKAYEHYLSRFGTSKVDWGDAISDLLLPPGARLGKSIYKNWK